MFAWKSSCPQRWPQGKFTLALADCHFDGHKNLSDGGKMWGNLSRHTWITWPPGPKLDPGGERERTWRESNFRYPKYHKHVFVDSAGFVPLSLQVKLQNQASQFRGNGPHTTPTPSHPKCQAKAISCNLATCGNELSREVRPLFSLSKSWLGPFPFLRLGRFPAKRFPLWGAN